MMFKHLLLAMPLAAAGCAAPTYYGSLDPDQSAALFDRAGRLQHRSPIIGYESRVPADPKPWRALNDGQAPKGGGS